MVYNKPVLGNNSQQYGECSRKYKEVTYYTLKGTANCGSTTTDYYIFDSESGVHYYDNFFTNENDKRTELYNKIIKKDFIKPSRYYTKYRLGRNNSDIVSVNYNSYFTDELGLLNILDIEKSFDNGTFLSYENTYVIGSGTYNLTEYMLGIKEVNNPYALSKRGTIRDDDIYKIYTFDYIPVVTLKDSIKIKSYDNCSDESIRGSESCPFELINNA